MKKGYGVLGIVLFASLAAAADDPKDWPSYNRDVLGSRHNRRETAINKSNAGTLEEKWRFPAKDSDLKIGVIHATPTVVDGYVYFGTATYPAFYKLRPDGKLCWSYRNPAYGTAQQRPPAAGLDKLPLLTRIQLTVNGIFSSALVTDDTVYFDDTAGWIYALNRSTGAERWKVNSRAKEFPGAHAANVFFASPIMADGKLIAAGGAIEQVIAAMPGYKGCTGRGFVVALEPATGKIVWKYDVGPKPEPLDPPMVIKDSYGSHKFYFGPSSSSIWCTPSYDADMGTLFFGTDTNNSPRRPTTDDPRIYTRDSCAIIALDAHTGAEKWVTQINPEDVWIGGMRAYDPKQGRYKDQSIGDTPKLYTIDVAGNPTKVVGAGSKNGGFYVLKAADGKIVDHTPIFTGPPSYPLSPTPSTRLLALPSAMGGIQTGCATDGERVYTNGIDTLCFGTVEDQAKSANPPTGGRVVALSLDLRTEHWRHERPKVPSIGGPPPKPIYTNVGDPVASGIAVANGVLYFTTVGSGKLVVLDAGNGSQLKEFDIGPVWAGPSLSRGRVYIGTGNTLFTPLDYESFFPKKYTGELISFGLPGEDEVTKLGGGKE
jgi:polyvinyl alcohol dehydrogenase (cytochrome)